MRPTPTRRCCPLARARMRAFALAIACDIHPVQNLRVLARPRALGLAEPQVQAWPHDTIAAGLAACEALLARQSGPCCFGDAPGLAGLCLVPQLFNARRFAVPPDGMARRLRTEAACLALPAFADTVAERQPDAEQPACSQRVVRVSMLRRTNPNAWGVDPAVPCWPPYAT